MRANHQQRPPHSSPLSFGIKNNGGFCSPGTKGGKPVLSFFLPACTCNHKATFANRLKGPGAPSKSLSGGKQPQQPNLVYLMTSEAPISWQKGGISPEMVKPFPCLMSTKPPLISRPRQEEVM